MSISKFSPPEAILSIASRLLSAGHETFFVGGCVRDVARGVTPNDYDITTAATPDEVMRIFDHVNPTGLAHGTVTVISDRHAAEVTTMRADSASSDGRHPDCVRFVTDIVTDLRRRDFTMNGMAISARDGSIVDPHEGMRDIQARTIRSIGAARDRFAEDGLRVMRALRFASQLGFSIDTVTLAHISTEFLTRVSRDRIHAELMKMLAAQGAQIGVDICNEKGMWEAITPRAKASRKPITAETLHGRILQLFPDDSLSKMISALKFGKSEVRNLRSEAKAMQYIASHRDKKRVREAISLFTRESCMIAADALSDDGLRMTVRDEIDASIGALPISGSDIMTRLNLSGAGVGWALRAASDLCIDNPTLLRDRDSLLKQLELVTSLTKVHP